MSDPVYDFSGLLKMLNYGQPAEQVATANPMAAFGALGGQVGAMAQPTDPGIFSQLGMFGGTDRLGNKVNGWGGMALGAASGLMNGFMGMQQYGLAKDQLKESRRQYDQNYAAQRQTVNTQLEDRQRARVASNPGAYESVSNYMNRNGIK